MRDINTAGINLIKEWEGFRSKPYRDAGGVWTIGYGSTKNIDADTPPITESEAESWMCVDLMEYERAVEDHISIDLTDNQFAALVSLCYNVGTRPLQLTLGHLLNQGKYQQAADEFLHWDHVGTKVINGLTRRREAERKLFLTD